MELQAKNNVGAAQNEAAGRGTPVLSETPMIARLWRGRVALERADEYRGYLLEAGVKKIAATPGNRGVQMMVSRGAEHADFMVSSYCDSIEAIRGFAGADCTRIRDLPRDREFLIDIETLARHFELDVNHWPVRLYARRPNRAPREARARDLSLKRRPNRRAARPR